MDEKTSTIRPKIKNDLYANPMVESAKKVMTKEQIEEYEKEGEYLFQNDFNTTQEGSAEPKKPELAEYALAALRSGLHPRDLRDGELDVLYSFCGPKWYEKFGYTADEVPTPQK